LFFFFLVAPVAFLTPLQVTRTFGADVWRLMVFEITFATGMILGGAILATWGGFKNKIHTMTLSSLITGICTLMLGLAPNFWIYLFFSALAGIALPLFNTPSTVLLQEKVEQNFLGRVFGIFGMIMSSMMPIGMLLFGPLADIVKIEWLLIITGLMLFFQSFYLLASKVLIEAGKPPEKV
jgi:DHA3 family macrolide efflux protein-like MFS transporter